tara:strand:- start:216 stop:458 length:243 start_codon:yes stop_codon:yes gene_type:complete
MVKAPTLVELAVQTPDVESMLPKSELSTDHVTGVTAPLAEKLVVLPLATVGLEGVTIMDEDDDVLVPVEVLFATSSTAAS